MLHETQKVGRAAPQKPHSQSTPADTGVGGGATMQHAAEEHMKEEGEKKKEKKKSTGSTVHEREREKVRPTVAGRVCWPATRVAHID